MKKEEQQKQPLLKIEDLAEQLGMKVGTIYARRFHKKPLPRAVRIGTSLRWTQESVDRFIEENEEE